MHYFLLVFLLSVTACFGNNNSHLKLKRDTGGLLVPHSYIVELKQDSNVTLDSFIHFIHHHSESVIIQNTISHKFLNAVSIRINIEKEDTTLKLILDHIDVESISPIQIFKQNQVVADKKLQNNLLTAHEIELMSPHRISQVDRVHNELSLTGEGVFIGIIDSGVDYYHPALGGGFGPGFKIQAGYDLVGNDFDLRDPNKPPQESPYPLDSCPTESLSTGHGTHVTGIIGGYDPINNFSGVAPGAKLGHWRVGGCNGDTASDIVFKAITMAYDAGVDVICVSFGYDLPWSAADSLQSKLIKRISDTGVSVVVATGNSGYQGAYTVASPASFTSAFSVGTVGNEYRYFDCSFNATGIAKPIACNLSRNMTDFTVEKKPLMDGSIALPNNEYDHACYNVSESVQGKIVLIPTRPLICENTIQLENIQKAGAIGVIFYDTSNAKYISIVTSNADMFVTVVSYDHGIALLKAYKRNPEISVKFSNDRPMYFFKDKKYASSASYFTGIGPTAELNFGSKITAVGEGIYSTVPKNKGSWMLMYGTSMSCPYVVGSIALYLQQHGINKTISSTFVEEKFQNYAFQPSAFNNTSGKLDHPLRVGAGAIQVYDAITQTTHITPAQISFNDTSSADYKMQTLTITNNGLVTVGFRISNNVSVAITPYNRAVSGYALLQPIQYTEAPAHIELSAVEISLLPGQSHVITATVNPPNTDPLDHIMYGGYLQFNPIDSSNAKALHVPYFGIVGSQNAIPMFTTDTRDFIIHVNGDTSFSYQLNDTITLQQDESIQVQIGFKKLMPTLVMKGEVLSNDKLVGQFVVPHMYLQRTYNTLYEGVIWKGGYYKDVTYDFNAMTQKTESDYEYTLLNSGTYYLRVSALRMFGNEKCKDDWDSFTAGPFIIEN